MYRHVQPTSPFLIAASPPPQEPVEGLGRVTEHNMPLEFRPSDVVDVARRIAHETRRVPAHA